MESNDSDFFKTNIKFIARALISVFCLGWIVYLLRGIDWAASLAALKSISSLYLVLGLSMVAMLYATRLIRLKYWVLTLSKPSLPSSSWLGLYLKSIALGSLTPARLGDFSRVPLLFSTGISLKTRTAIVILEKLWDLSYAPLAVLLSLNLLESRFAVPLHVSLLMVCLIPAVQFCLIFKLGSFLKMKAHLAGLVMTLFGFLFFILANVFIFLSVGLKLDAVSVITITTAAGVMASLPVSLGGIGIREGTLFVFLGLFGVSREAALPLVYLEFFVNIVFPVLLYGVFYSAEQLVKRKNRSVNQGERADHDSLV
jgi:hypothetical protein